MGIISRRSLFSLSSYFLLRARCEVTPKPSTTLGLGEGNSSRTRRLLPYVPPAPVTPFRGRLKSMPEDDDDDDDDDDAAAESFEAVGNRTRHGRSPEGSEATRAASHTAPSSWAPEGYPDPWTDPARCLGKITEISRDASQPVEVRRTGRPLLCDPDRVLDGATRRDVADRLRVFAERFAGDAEAEDGDFGTRRRVRGSDEFANDRPIGISWRRQRESDVDQPVGGVFAATRRRKGARETEALEERRIEVGIALVQKINLPAILRADSYFFYSDQNDMLNDAAQFFARYIHDAWSKRLAADLADDEGTSPASDLVLVFISTLDGICYISSGSGIVQILPWWRLEHVVQDMKQDLRNGQTGEALAIAIDSIATLLLAGPPTFAMRVEDFFQRFGVVLLFTLCTFLFATWGECRDRRKRTFFAEARSRMTSAERERARLLQAGFKTSVCPICLEPFPGRDADSDTAGVLHKDTSPDEQSQQIKRVDSLGTGTDGKPIKMLRCGHIFDETCWRMWVESGHGCQNVCPVCRQDLGRTNTWSVALSDRAGEGSNDNDTEGSDSPDRERSSLFSRLVSNAAASSVLANYSSIPPLLRRGTGAPFGPLSHPTFRSLRWSFQPSLGTETPPPAEGLDERTPLFTHISTINEEENEDY